MIPCRIACLVLLFSTVAPSAHAATLPVADASGVQLHVWVQAYGYAAGPVAVEGFSNQDSTTHGSLSIEPVGDLGLQAAYRVALDAVDAPLTFYNTIGLFETPVSLRIDEYAFDVPLPSDAAVVSGVPDGGLPMRVSVDFRGELMIGAITTPFAYEALVIEPLHGFAEIRGASLSGAVLRNGRVGLIERSLVVIDDVPFVLFAELTFSQIRFVPEPSTGTSVAIALAVAVGMRLRSKA